MNLFPRSRVPNYCYSIRMINNLWSIWIIFFCFFFCNIIKFNHFLYLFITLLHLISSLSLTKSLLLRYVNVSIESIAFFLLSSFELKRILLISSVKTLCLAYLNLTVSLVLIYCFLWIIYDFFNAIYINSFFFVEIFYFIIKLICF